MEKNLAGVSQAISIVSRGTRDIYSSSVSAPTPSPFFFLTEWTIFLFVLTTNHGENTSCFTNTYYAVRQNLQVMVLLYTSLT